MSISKSKSKKKNIKKNKHLHKLNGGVVYLTHTQNIPVKNIQIPIQEQMSLENQIKYQKKLLYQLEQKQKQQLMQKIQEQLHQEQKAQQIQQEQQVQQAQQAQQAQQVQQLQNKVYKNKPNKYMTRKKKCINGSINCNYEKRFKVPPHHYHIKK